jgi:hypothetical protein
MTTHYIMSTDGSFMDIDTCYVVNAEDLSAEQLEELAAGTNDSTIAAMAEEHGQWLPKWTPWFDWPRRKSESAAANESGSIS